MLLLLKKKKKLQYIRELTCHSTILLCFITFSFWTYYYKIKLAGCCVLLRAKNHWIKWFSSFQFVANWPTAVPPLLSALHILYNSRFMFMFTHVCVLQVVLGPLIAIALKISSIHERTGRRGPTVITWSERQDAGKGPNHETAFF